MNPAEWSSGSNVGGRHVHVSDDVIGLGVIDSAGNDVSTGARNSRDPPGGIENCRRAVPATRTYAGNVQFSSVEPNKSTFSGPWNGTLPRLRTRTGTTTVRPIRITPPTGPPIAAASSDVKG